MSQLSSPIQGPPYPPTTAGLGGIPTTGTDIPISAVFIVLFICFAVTNMTILQKNRRRGHKFLLSGVMFGFCMARIGTLVLRIAWSTRHSNVRLAIAAQIFVNAGILLIYIVNLVLAQRILRAKQPHIGWKPVIRVVYKILYFAIGAALVMVITSVVLSVYTLNQHTRSICRDIQLAAITYLLVFTCLPIVHLIAAFFLPKSKDEETLGEGSMRSKAIIITVSTILCMTIAGFKAGTTWKPLPPIQHPAWYDSKSCFYVFNFTLEILTLSVLTLSRIDKRFFIPNGCKNAGDYTRKRQPTVPSIEATADYRDEIQSEKSESGSPRIAAVDEKL